MSRNLLKKNIQCFLKVRGQYFFFTLVGIKDFKVLLNTQFCGVIQTHEIKSYVMCLTSDTVLHVRDGRQESRGAPTNIREIDG